MLKQPAATAGIFEDVNRDDTPICVIYTLVETPRPVATAGPDIALWRHDQDDFKPYFSASKTWNYLRVKKTKPPWHCIVWFPQAIPRQSFMVWLAFKDRLSTGIRMRDWGMEQCCIYC